MGLLAAYQQPKIERAPGGIHDASTKVEWAEGFLIEKQRVYHPYLNKDATFELDLSEYPSIKQKYIRQP